MADERCVPIPSWIAHLMAAGFRSGRPIPCGARIVQRREGIHREYRCTAPLGHPEDQHVWERTRRMDYRK